MASVLSGLWKRLTNPKNEPVILQGLVERFDSLVSAIAEIREENIDVPAQYNGFRDIGEYRNHNLRRLADEVAETSWSAPAQQDTTDRIKRAEEYFEQESKKVLDVVKAHLQDKCLPLMEKCDSLVRDSTPLDTYKYERGYQLARLTSNIELITGKAKNNRAPQILPRDIVPSQLPERSASEEFSTPLASPGTSSPNYASPATSRRSSISEVESEPPILNEKEDFMIVIGQGIEFSKQAKEMVTQTANETLQYIKDQVNNEISNIQALSEELSKIPGPRTHGYIIELDEYQRALQAQREALLALKTIDPENDYETNIAHTLEVLSGAKGRLIPAHRRIQTIGQLFEGQGESFLTIDRVQEDVRQQQEALKHYSSSLRALDSTLEPVKEHPSAQSLRDRIKKAISTADSNLAENDAELSSQGNDLDDKLPLVAWMGYGRTDADQKRLEDMSKEAATCLELVPQIEALVRRIQSRQEQIQTNIEDLERKRIVLNEPTDDLKEKRDNIQAQLANLLASLKDEEANLTEMTSQINGPNIYPEIIRDMQGWLDLTDGSSYANLKERAEDYNIRVEDQLKKSIDATKKKVEPAIERNLQKVDQWTQRLAKIKAMLDPQGKSPERDRLNDVIELIEKKIENTREEARLLREMPHDASPISSNALQELKNGLEILNDLPEIDQELETLNIEVISLSIKNGAGAVFSKVPAIDAAILQFYTHYFEIQPPNPFTDKAFTVYFALYSGISPADVIDKDIRKVVTILKSVLENGSNMAELYDQVRGATGKSEFEKLQSLSEKLRPLTKFEKAVESDLSIHFDPPLQLEAVHIKGFCNQYGYIQGVRLNYQQPLSNLACLYGLCVYLNANGIASQSKLVNSELLRLLREFVGREATLADFMDAYNIYSTSNEEGLSNNLKARFPNNDCIALNNLKSNGTLTTFQGSKYFGAQGCDIDSVLNDLLSDQLADRNSALKALEEIARDTAPIIRASPETTAGGRISKKIKDDTATALINNTPKIISLARAGAELGLAKSAQAPSLPEVMTQLRTEGISLKDFVSIVKLGDLSDQSIGEVINTLDLGGLPQNIQKVDIEDYITHPGDLANDASDENKAKRKTIVDFISSYANKVFHEILLGSQGARKVLKGKYLIAQKLGNSQTLTFAEHLMIGSRLISDELQRHLQHNYRDIFSLLSEAKFDPSLVDIEKLNRHARDSLLSMSQDKELTSLYLYLTCLAGQLAFGALPTRNSLARLDMCYALLSDPHISEKLQITPEHVGALKTLTNTSNTLKVTQDPIQSRYQEGTGMISKDSQRVAAIIYNKAIADHPLQSHPSLGFIELSNRDSVSNINIIRAQIERAQDTSSSFLTSQDMIFMTSYNWEGENHILLVKLIPNTVGSYDVQLIDSDSDMPSISLLSLQNLFIAAVNNVTQIKRRAAGSQGVLSHSSTNVRPPFVKSCKITGLPIELRQEIGHDNDRDIDSSCSCQTIENVYIQINGEVNDGSTLIVDGLGNRYKLDQYGLYGASKASDIDNAIARKDLQSLKFHTPTKPEYVLDDPLVLDLPNDMGEYHIRSKEALESLLDVLYGETIRPIQLGGYYRTSNLRTLEDVITSRLEAQRSDMKTGDQDPVIKALTLQISKEKERALSLIGIGKLGTDTNSQVTKIPGNPTRLADQKAHTPNDPQPTGTFGSGTRLLISRALAIFLAALVNLGRHIMLILPSPITSSAQSVRAFGQKMVGYFQD